jgi:hypothetical protein
MDNELIRRVGVYAQSVVSGILTIEQVPVPLRTYVQRKIAGEPLEDEPETEVGQTIEQQVMSLASTADLLSLFVRDLLEAADE